MPCRPAETAAGPAPLQPEPSQPPEGGGCKKKKKKQKGAGNSAAESAQPAASELPHPVLEQQPEGGGKKNKRKGLAGGSAVPAAPAPSAGGSTPSHPASQQPGGEGEGKGKKKQGRRGKQNSEGRDILQQLGDASGEESDAAEAGEKPKLQDGHGGLPGEDQPGQHETGDFVFFSRVTRGSACNLKPHLGASQAFHPTFDGVFGLWIH